MIYFLVFAAVTALLFFLLLFLLRRVIPIHPFLTLILVGISFSLTVAFPYANVRMGLAKTLFLYLVLAVLAGIILYQVDRMLEKIKTATVPEPDPGLENTGAYVTETVTATSASAMEQEIEIDMEDETNQAREPHPEQTTATSPDLSPKDAETDFKVDEACDSSTQPGETAGAKVELDRPGEFTPPQDADIATDLSPDDAETNTALNSGVKPDGVADAVGEPSQDTISRPGHGAQTMIPKSTIDGEQVEQKHAGKNVPDSSSGPSGKNTSELDYYLSRAFSHRQEKNLIKAADYFMQALHLSGDPVVSAKIGLELSAVFYLMGQKWQAKEILKVILRQWEADLPTRLVQELKSTIHYLENR